MTFKAPGADLRSYLLGYLDPGAKRQLINHAWREGSAPKLAQCPR